MIGSLILKKKLGGHLYLPLKLIISLNFTVLLYLVSRRKINTQICKKKKSIVRISRSKIAINYCLGITLTRTTMTLRKLRNIRATNTVAETKLRVSKHQLPWQCLRNRYVQTIVRSIEAGRPGYEARKAYYNYVYISSVCIPHMYYC